MLAHFRRMAKWLRLPQPKSAQKISGLNRLLRAKRFKLPKTILLMKTPIWSPNGDELAFFSKKNGEAGFWRIPTLGGSAKLIAKTDDGGSRLQAWSKN